MLVFLIFGICFQFVYMVKPPPPTNSNYCYEQSPGTPCSYDKVLLWPPGLSDRLVIEADFPAKFYFVVLYTYNTALYNFMYYDQATKMLSVSPPYVTDNMTFNYAQSKDQNWYMNMVLSKSLIAFNVYPGLDPILTSLRPQAKHLDFLRESYNNGYFGSSTIKTLYENNDIFYGVFVPCYPKVLGMLGSELERNGTISERFGFSIGMSPFQHGKELSKDFKAVSPHQTTNRCLSSLHMPNTGTAMAAVVYASFEDINLYFQEKFLQSCRDYEVVIEAAEINEVMPVNTSPVGNRQELIFHPLDNSVFDVSFPVYEALGKRIGFAPYTFPVWSRLYMLTRVTARLRSNPANKATKVFESTFIYGDSPPKAYIDGLDGEDKVLLYTDLKDGLHLTANRSFDRREGRQHLDPLTALDFTWSCKKTLIRSSGTPQSHSVNCPAPQPHGDVTNFYIPNNALESGLEYDPKNMMRNKWIITVRVTCKDNSSLTASAKRIITIGVIGHIPVRCVSNCMGHITFIPMTLKVDDFPLKDKYLNWQWYAYKFNQVYRPEDVNPTREFIGNGDFEAIGSNTDELTIPAGKLSWSTRYTFLVEAFYEGNPAKRGIGRGVAHSKPVAYSTLLGWCTVQPSIGFALFTKFLLNCANFGIFYSYRFHMAINGITLFETKTIPASKQMVFPLLSNMSGEVHTFVLTADVDPDISGFTITPYQYTFPLKLYSRTGGALEDVANFLNYRKLGELPFAEVQQLVWSMEFMLNYSLTAEKMSNATQLEQNELKYKLIMEEKLTEANVSSEEDVLAKVTQLEKIVAADNGTFTVLHAESACNILENIISALLELESPKALNKTLQSLVTSLSAVLDLHSEGDSTFSKEEMQEQMKKCQASVKTLLGIASSSDNFKFIGRDSDNFTFTGPSMSVQVQAVCESGSAWLEFSPASESVEMENVTAVFPDTFSVNILADRCENSAQYIQVCFADGMAMFQMVVYQGNPYMWTDATVGVTSPVLEVSLASSNNNATAVTNIEDPIIIYLPFLGNLTEETNDGGNSSNATLGTSIEMTGDFLLEIVKVRVVTRSAQKVYLTVATDPSDTLVYVYRMSGDFSSKDSFFTSSGSLKSMYIDHSTRLPRSDPRLGNEDTYTAVASTSGKIATYFALILNVSRPAWLSPPATTVDVTIETKAYTGDCLSWASESNQWNHTGCQMGSLTSLELLHCTCHQLAPVAGSVQSTAVQVLPLHIKVPPGEDEEPSIQDPSSSRALFVHGAIVLSSVWVIFTALGFWAYRKEQRNPYLRCVTPVPGIEGKHGYQYLVCLHLGGPWPCVTRPESVDLCLVGSLASSPVSTAVLKRRGWFLQEVERWFLVTSSCCLGELDYVAVAHHLGSNVKYIKVMDLKERTMMHFAQDGSINPDIPHSVSQAEPAEAVVEDTHTRTLEYGSEPTLQDAGDKEASKSTICVCESVFHCLSPEHWMAQSGFRIWLFHQLQNFTLVFNIFIDSPAKKLRSTDLIAGLLCCFVLTLTVLLILADFCGFTAMSQYSLMLDTIAVSMKDIGLGIISAAVGSVTTQLIMMLFGWYEENNLREITKEAKKEPEDYASGDWAADETVAVVQRSSGLRNRHGKLQRNAMLLFLSAVIPLSASGLIYHQVLLYTPETCVQRLLSLLAGVLSLGIVIEPVKCAVISLIFGGGLKYLPAYKIPDPLTPEQLVTMKKQNRLWRVKNNWYISNDE